MARKSYNITGTSTILDLVRESSEAEAYRDSVNKSYAKPWKLFSSPPDSVWQEYQGLEYDINEKRFDIFHNPNPTKGLEKMSAFDAMNRSAGGDMNIGGSITMSEYEQNMNPAEQLKY